MPSYIGRFYIYNDTAGNTKDSQCSYFTVLKEKMSNKEEIQKLIKDNDELENYFRNTIIPQLFID
ncbi:MAG: hypothetical protein H7X88_12130, partial [Gloeobacteraceae cyanobacterium ES-bin-316]|nr:hypothetical protein [Ferruginibacter sp.]